MGAKMKHEDDFLLWAQEQAGALREAESARTNLPIDFGHVAEEIADLGRSIRHAARSYCAQIIVHLLKLAHSPAVYPRRSWQDEIARLRMELALLIDESPSLGTQLDDLVRGVWRYSRQRALADLARDGIDDSGIPEACPFTVAEIVGR